MGSVESSIDNQETSSDQSKSFNTVVVSEEVVKRLTGAGGTTTDTRNNHTHTEKEHQLRTELERERKYREQLERELSNREINSLGADANEGMRENVHVRERELQALFAEKLSDRSKVLPEQTTQRHCNTACAAEEQMVLKCYSDYRKQTLNCINQANNFQQCVDKSRRQVLSAKS